jgi:hypothetical protein
MESSLESIEVLGFLPSTEVATAVVDGGKAPIVSSVWRSSSKSLSFGENATKA